jgi:hypothetical protein
VELSARIGYRYQMPTVPHRMIGCYAVRDGALAALMLYRSSSQALPSSPAAAWRERFGDLGWMAPSSAWRISVRDLAFRLSGLPVVRSLIRGSVMPGIAIPQRAS